MGPLPSQWELRERKALEYAELQRREQRLVQERRGLEEAIARYWELLGEFAVRAGELGIAPATHKAGQHRGAPSRIEWVEGYQLTGGSIVSTPPLRYCLRERRLIHPAHTEVLEVEAVSLFVLSSDAGLAASLSGPKTALAGEWPPVKRWDRMANILIALEAELEASLLRLMGPAAAQ
jgi:hypothetical protein